MLVGTIGKLVIGAVVGVGAKQVVKTVVSGAVQGISIDRKTQILLDIGSVAIGIAVGAFAAKAIEEQITSVEQTIEMVKLQTMKNAEIVEIQQKQEEAE